MLFAALLVLALQASTPDSALRVAQIFSDGVVLQRDRALPIWGTSRPGAGLTVSFRGATEHTTSDPTGHWRVVLPASKAGGPFEMSIAGDGETRVIHDVLVGDVWFASGQSNMEFSLAGARNGAEAIAVANDSMIRQFKVPRSSATSPEAELAGGSWMPADSRRAGSFSAVGYFFARDVRKATGIPIAIINSSWGGSAIEAWLSAGAWRLHAGKVFDKSFEERTSDGQRPYSKPSLLYNKMVYPLRDFPIAGVLWYQGESNANTVEKSRAHREQFNALVTSWRSEFSASARDLPFLWVQLPNYGAADSVPPLTAAWALLRESMDAALRLPKTGRAITIDIGEAGNIHPRNKEDVGARLARVALARVYGQKVAFEGPTFSSWSVGGRCAVVTFTNADSLHTTNGKSPAGFAIAGSDRKFTWADAEIRGNTVRVCSDGVTKPAAVRYAFANNPPVNLVNGAALPAAPFRTDTW